MSEPGRPEPGADHPGADERPDGDDARPARGTAPAPDLSRPDVVDVPEAHQPPPPDGIRRLWAPWRYGYVAGGAAIEGCPFCVLPARGPEHDAESLILHRGETCYVVFNAYPYNPGHLMAVPFDHVADLEDLHADTADELWRLGRRCVAALKQRLACDGVNLGMNLGSAAGAGLAEHVHLHVVPRWTGDTNFVSVVGATRVLPRAMADMYDEMSGAFGDL